MRLWTLLVMLVVVCVAACGDNDQVGDPGDLVPSSTETTQAAPSTMTEAAPSTTAAAATTTTSTRTTTSTVPQAAWTVSVYGLTPTESLSGTDALGSGCAPGTDDLPDGVWFGWVKATGSDYVEFDLACLWPGRIQPAASNDTTKLRYVATSFDTLVYPSSADPVSFGAWDGRASATENAPGLPQVLPFWLFLNDGLITEMTEYPESLDWMMHTAAWPGLIPGCCEGGTVAPASPTDPWPEEGWPSDGFYSAAATIRDDEIDLTLRKWLSCSEHPERCAPWWTGGEVTSDPDAPTLQRSIPFDHALTVVILPIASDTPIVGDGRALEALHNDLTTAIDAWLVGSTYDKLTQLSKDPAFPFGSPDGQGLEHEWYRGPGGVHLTPYGDQVTLPGWTALEVRNGRPILYIDAGIIAG
jgi:hypothetical protein